MAPVQAAVLAAAKQCANSSVDITQPLYWSMPIGIMEIFQEVGADFGLMRYLIGLFSLDTMWYTGSRAGRFQPASGLNWFKLRF